MGYVRNIGFFVDPKTQERIAYDRDTGQVLRETLPPVVFLGKPKTFNELYGRGAWWVMSDSLPDLMAFDKELSRQEPTRVFWYLVKRLDFENYIRVPQSEIVEALEIKKSNVSRAISLLESKGVLLRGPKVGQSYSWRLNPNCGFKGNPRGKVVRLHNGKIGFKSADLEADSKETKSNSEASSRETHCDSETNRKETHRETHRETHNNSKTDGKGEQ